MFNTTVFNNIVFNNIAQDFGAQDQDDIVFNNYSLQNADIVTSIQVQDNMPIREFQTVAKPRSHGSIAIGDYFRDKNIRLNGYIRKPTASLLNQEIDNMKKALRVREGNLDIKINGEIRRYKATLDPSNILFDRRQGYHITLCPFDISFRCIDSFAYKPDYESEGFIDQTTLNFSEQVNNFGTVETLPVVILNFTQVDSIGKITVTNNTTGEIISLTAAISANDYVRFDSENKVVTINGVEQDYDGIFPQLIAGANALNVALTGTSATYTMTLKHKTPYL